MYIGKNTNSLTNSLCYNNIFENMYILYSMVGGIMFVDLLKLYFAYREEVLNDVLVDLMKKKCSDEIQYHTVL